MSWRPPSEVLQERRGSPHTVGLQAWPSATTATPRPNPRASCGVRNKGS